MLDRPLPRRDAGAVPTVRDNPGVIAPPPLLFAGVLAAALLIDFQVVRTPTGVPGAVRVVAAVAELAVAVALMARALAGLRRAGTNVEPWRPSTALVTTGVYRVSRNPIYLAMTLLYLAAALAADSLLALLLLLPLLLVVHHGVIAREERYLDAKFGESYRRYRGAVRRWF